MQEVRLELERLRQARPNDEAAGDNVIADALSWAPEGFE